jgi:hypothetical protein
MNEFLLNKEQVENLTYEQCQTALKQLSKKYDLEKPISKLNKEEWANCDAVCNTLLWLEDRIKLFEDPRIPSMNPGVVVIKTKKPVVTKSKTGRPARRFKIDDTVYENIHDAVKRTGIKKSTLQTYVSRHPHKYSYVD